MADLRIQLVNAVGGGDINQELNLRKLSDSLNTHVNRYEPEHHPSLYLRFAEEGATVLVFRTGKYNIAGAESVPDLINSSDTLLNKLSDLGINVSGVENTFEVRNLVFSAEFETEFELNELTIALGLENAEYEPEQFPGIQFNPQSGNGLFLIFRTGKVLLIGVTEENTANDLFSNLNEKLTKLGAI